MSELSPQLWQDILTKIQPILSDVAVTAIQESIRSAPRPILRPGTVVSLTASYVNVRVDGDTDTTPTQPLGSAATTTGSRVMVLFMPPMGVFSFTTSQFTEPVPTYPTLGSDEPWIAPTLLNSWVRYDAASPAYNTPGYYKDRWGWVHLRGLVKSGANSTVIFTLPATHKPARRVARTICWDNAGGFMLINPGTGDVALFKGGAGGTPATFAQLDGISFPGPDLMDGRLWHQPIYGANYGRDGTYTTDASYWPPAAMKNPFNGIWTYHGILTGATAIGTIIQLPGPRFQTLSQHITLGVTNTGAFGVADIRYGGNVQTNLMQAAGAVSTSGLVLGNVYHPDEYTETNLFTAVTFQNSWENYSGVNSDQASAGYYKDDSGMVWLKGLIKKSPYNAAATANQILFTLPAGYRPAGTGIDGKYIFATASNSIFGRVDVYPNGDVVVETGRLEWISLAGIHFRAEQ